MSFFGFCYRPSTNVFKVTIIKKRIAFHLAKFCHTCPMSLCEGSFTSLRLESPPLKIYSVLI